MEKPEWWDRHFQHWSKEKVDFETENQDKITAWETNYDPEKGIRSIEFKVDGQKVTFIENY